MQSNALKDIQQKDVLKLFIFLTSKWIYKNHNILNNFYSYRVF